MRRKALEAAESEPTTLDEQTFTSAQIARAADAENVSPRSVLNTLAGVYVRGLAGKRARRAAVSLRGGAYSDRPSEWLVIVDGSSPVIVSEHGATTIGSCNGWACIATLESEVQDDRRVEALTVSLTKGEVEVRTCGVAVEGEPTRSYSPLQVCAGVDRKTIVTVAFSTRAVP